MLHFVHGCNLLQNTGDSITTDRTVRYVARDGLPCHGIEERISVVPIYALGKQCVLSGVFHAYCFVVAFQAIVPHAPSFSMCIRSLTGALRLTTTTTMTDAPLSGCVASAT